MTLEEALKHFNSGYDLCKKLNISHSNMVRWKKQNFIPVAQQLKINQIIEDNLPIDIDKEAMDKRVLEKGL